MHHRRLQRWMRQRTLQLFMVTALCIIGLEGTMLVYASPQTKDNASTPDPEPVAREGPNGTTATAAVAMPGADRQRRLIPYMQYYVTSTAAPAGPDNGDYQPPPSPYSQLYNYRPIPHRKPYYGTAGGLKALPVSVNPFTYEYNHRHQSPVKVVGSGGGAGSPSSSHGPTSYALVGSAPQSTEHGGHGPQSAVDHVVEVYERPKYAVIPRERDPYEGPRFAGKLYGVEVHPKSQPHGGSNENVEVDPLAGAKYFLPTVAPESRKPALYQAVPVYKKSRINPFLPSNTIPGPFTPMVSGSSGVAHVDPTGNQEPRVKEHAVQVTFVKSVSKETIPPSAVEYQPYVTASPPQSNRVHGEVSQSPYLLVKTVPKFYYEKPRIAPVSSTAAPYPVYYKEKPSDGRKPQQHFNHTGYTRTRIPVAVIRVPVESHPANEGFAEPPPNAGYYSVGSYYKYPEQAAVPPRQHLTETVHPQKHVVHQEPPVSKAPPATQPGQYFLGANYKIIKVPVKQQPYPVDQPYPVSYAPQRVIPSTTHAPIVYSTTPSTTPAPVHETPDYHPVVYHGQRPAQYQAPARSNRTEYRQRFYPQSMRHPSQHKPRPIPLVPPTDHQELGLPAGSASSSLSDLLKSLQDSNLLPKTLTPDNIDNSIRTLVKILNNLKANGRPTSERVVPGPAYGRRQNHTVPEPEDGYVDADQYHGGGGGGAGPPMLINKIVTPGPNTGKPGIDYPALAEIPETSFSCKEQRYKGFFGDPETNCQVWHYCDLNGGKASFLCPNGTIFSQVALTCDWWFNVKCSTTAQLYVLNERLYKYILPFTPKFPEDYSGPLVDKYLALKFQEMEEKMKQQRAKGAKQSAEPLPNTEPDNDEVNGNRLEDNDDRYNQNQPYPVKYVTTEAIAERGPVVPALASNPAPRPASPSGAITLEDIDAELQPGAGTSTTSAGPPMTSEEVDESSVVTPVSNYRTSSPATTTLIINTEEPEPGPDPSYQEEMMMMMLVEPEDRVEHEYANVVVGATEQPTAAPLLGKVRRIEVKNDGTSGHLIRTPSYDRRRKK
ncbi:uncharacterized protein LOC128271165 [Anopheles cruzii]|uniref:uncharacterized protein LOC128271165 n=1 Tax=Anopheles cruzii TaxID=68878 RepID=UPI0022EC6F56|nr:uncharacterized protein LOC128271165 [Anopheles cruzii]